MKFLLLGMSPARKYFRWSRIFPVIHVFLCATGLLGGFVSGWDGLQEVWGFLIKADLPWSVVYMVVGMTHEWLAVLLIVIIGTSWWYLLGRLAEYLFDRLGKRWTSGPGFAP
jgi:hypothetical protein